MSFQIRQDCSAGAEAGVHRLLSLHLLASYTYLSLGCFFDCDNVAVGGRGPFFRELAREQHEGDRPNVSGSCRTSTAATPSSWMCRSHPKMSGAEPGRHGAALALEKTLNQALPDLHAMGSAHPDPHLGDFLEKHFLGEEVKLLTEMGDHQTNLSRRPAPEPGGARIPLRAPPPPQT
ncbi:ferritin light chain-like [Tenrec ecaudatus]|uniref:ferritin light chain-like n=1 Tax=Tenrec ecaudatus TaxID=94439 RepID=UPI003F5AC8F8